jgi:CheY-like chemotaxis protein/tetratricopeptide (TPR) repeat protein
MIISSQLLHQIADPSLPKNERAKLRCQLAKELEDVGNYEAAREAMGELWSRVGEHPVLDELDEVTAAEALLRVGTLTGWLGSTRQIEGAQEAAKNLISESITRFEVLHDEKKIGEAQTELGYCYWREGSFNEARAVLQEARKLLSDEDSDLKAVSLLRGAAIEKVTNRLSDALHLLVEAAPLFDASKNETIKGRFHNEYAQVLRKLSAAEGRGDYIDRALIEYAAASYHFERAGHRRYHACVENNLGFLFCTIKRFAEAHEHLDRAQALFTGMKDDVHTAQVDDTRARVLLAEGRIAEAEKLVRSAVRTLGRGGEQSLLAEALTTHGIVLARMGSHEAALRELQRAVEAAQGAGDTEAEGLAVLTMIEELSEHMLAEELTPTYDRALELLSRSGNQEYKDRLLAASRRVLFLSGALATPPTWEGFNLYKAVVRYEARIVERALKEARGVVSRAAELLGIRRQRLDAMLKGKGRHTALAHLRTPVERRPRSLMFRGDEDCPETRAVVVLHVEDDSVIADGVSMTLHGEGWSVEMCMTGAAALERLEGGERYDVLIFDNGLPDTTGIELIRRTRALAHRQQTPIIMLSGDEVETEARRAGANKFLRKPGDVGSIPETVARLLARKKGRES